MAGIQIYTESPISPAVQAPSESSTISSEQTSSTTSKRYPRSAAASKGENRLAEQEAPSAIGTHTEYSSTYGPSEPEISPPTPTVGSPSIPANTPVPKAVPMPLERSSSNSSAPPSPQPNALPTPLHSRSRSASPRRDIPPPPKVGEKMKPASYYSPTPTPTYPSQAQNLPPQIGFSSVTDAHGGAQPSALGTVGQSGLLSPHPNGLLSPGRNYASPAQTPTSATMPQKNLEHPPGYQQNPYAADMTPEQRFASQRGAGSPSLGYNDGNTGLGGMKSPSGMFQGISGMVSPRPGGGILNGDGKPDDSTVWGMVSGWAKGAGKKLSEVEGEVWRRINGE